MEKNRKESVIDSEWKLFDSGKYEKRTVNTRVVYANRFNYIWWWFINHLTTCYDFTYGYTLGSNTRNISGYYYWSSRITSCLLP